MKLFAKWFHRMADRYPILMALASLYFPGIVK